MDRRTSLLLRFLPAAALCGLLSFGDGLPALWWNIAVAACVIAILFFALTSRLPGKSLVGKLLLALAVFILYELAAAAVPNSFSVPLGGEPETAEYRSEEIGEERARLVATNEEALEQRIRMIREARNEVILTTFEWNADNSGTDVIAALYSAAERGVQVQVLVDGFSAALGLDTSPAFRALAAHPNTQIKIYNRLNVLLPWRTSNRMHDKYLIIDDTCYLLGGRNTSDLFLGNYPVSRVNSDMEVLVWQPTDSDSSSLSQLRDYFQTIWAQRYCTPFRGGTGGEAALTDRYEALKAAYPACFDDYDYQAETCETNRITLLSGPTEPLRKEPKLFYALTALMKEAKERVVIHTPYAIFNKTMYRELAEVADNVPKTALMLNSPGNGANLFGSSDYLLQKKKLLATGFTFYEYEGGSSYHGKMILVDRDISVVGSFNMDMRSVYLDTELMAVIQSSALNAQMETYMETVHSRCRRVISAVEYAPSDFPVSETSGGKLLLYHLLKYLDYPLRHLL